MMVRYLHLYIGLKTRFEHNHKAIIVHCDPPDSFPDQPLVTPLPQSSAPNSAVSQAKKSIS